jgi:hypothetical protein
LHGQSVRRFSTLRASYRAESSDRSDPFCLEQILAERSAKELLFRQSSVARGSAATPFDRDSYKIHRAPRIVIAATRILIKAEEILESLIFRA